VKRPAKKKALYARIKKDPDAHCQERACGARTKESCEMSCQQKRLARKDQKRHWNALPKQMHEGQGKRGPIKTMISGKARFCKKKQIRGRLKKSS
jgi:hypothetical protein